MNNTFGCPGGINGDKVNPFDDSILEGLTPDGRARYRVPSSTPTKLVRTQPDLVGTGTSRGRDPEAPLEEELD